MRFVLSVALGGALFFASMSLAYAQTSNGNTDGETLYNQNAQPLSLSQAVAGINAPSYNYGRSNASAGTYQPQGTLTAEQEALLQDQFEQQQAFNEFQALQSLQNGGAGFGAEDNSFAAQLARLRGGGLGAEETQPTKRVVKRVVRNALNDPLTAPPRLFNPDQ